MAWVKYVGDHDEVEVPDARQIVKKGETIQVEDELAKRLLDQEDNWKKATASKSAQKDPA